MAAYQLTLRHGVIRTSDGAFIPDDERNKDWQEFKDWVAKGNTPDPVGTTQFGSVRPV